jgi:anti-anti-sigma factor
MASSAAPNIGRSPVPRPERDSTPPIGLSTLVVGDTAVVRIEGDLDHHTGSQLLACAQILLGDGARNVVIDCASTAFLDSGGLEVLLELHDIVHLRSGTLTVRNCSEAIRRVFDVTALAHHLGVEPPRSR